MITLVLESDNITADQYDEACRLADVTQSNVPDGLIFHSATATDTGFLVVDVWESEEKFGAFAERLGPALGQVGIEIQPRIYKTHAVIAGKVTASV